MLARQDADMNTLIARCPHCDTSFRVVPDQLRVRNGKVRCGVCHRIFDARAALADAGISLDDDEIAAPRARSASPPVVQRERHEPELGRPSESPWVASDREPRIGDSELHHGSHSTESRRFSASRPDAPLPPALANNGNGGVMRLLFGLGFWIALLVLLAQALYWWRTPLATHIPALRAPFEAVCLSFGCEVGSVRAPQRLAIVSSAVQPDVFGGTADAQRLRLQAVLRNRASHAQPWPTLEVTLTDHADGVVARRAVPPEVYLPAGEQHLPFPAGAEREIHLSLVAHGAPVTGYRLALFFP